MSSEAIVRRLRLAGDLRDLSISLMKAKRLHDEKMEKHRLSNNIHADPANDRDKSRALK